MIVNVQHFPKGASKLTSLSRWHVYFGCVFYGIKIDIEIDIFVFMHLK